MAKRLLFLSSVFLAFFFSCGDAAHDPQTITTLADSLDRPVAIPARVSRIICSGSGCLRYFSYMQCQESVVAVDDMEGKRQTFEARPYFLANPQFAKLPVFGEFRGFDNPELILALDPAPQIIFKTYPEQGFNPDELAEKTGIPVFTLAYGDLCAGRPVFYATLRQIGAIMDKKDRAEEIIRYLDDAIADLDKRTRDIPERKTCYIGGVSSKGPLGLEATETGYPPFAFLNTPNAAGESDSKTGAHRVVSKEKIIEWDPEVIFIDLASLQADARASALYELKNNPAYKTLRALKSGQIYGVLPYNWYTQNHECTLANAYYIGSVLYPERFADIDPVKKADEIFSFFTGKSVFAMMNESFQNLVYTRIR